MFINLIYKLYYIASGLRLSEAFVVVVVVLLLLLVAAILTIKTYF
jgi:hypothetical protein